jgi:peroxiredoxin
MASVPLRATDGDTVDLSAIPGRTVVYAYPRTGRPGIDNPEGWDMIPGARGCTPQSCSFRDHFAELRDLGVNHLFGLSTQDPEYQREAAERLHLPFTLLSDENLPATNRISRSSAGCGRARSSKVASTSPSETKRRTVRRSRSTVQTCPWPRLRTRTTSPQG